MTRGAAAPRLRHVSCSLSVARCHVAWPARIAWFLIAWPSRAPRRPPRIATAPRPVRVDATVGTESAEKARATSSTASKSNPAASQSLQALIERGLVKAKNFRNSANKRAYLYLLTPRGIEDKAIVTARFLRIKLAEYEALKTELEQLQQEATRPAVAKVADDAK
jgi:EPS-associated MarR family transcriptional regulator